MRHQHFLKGAGLFACLALPGSSPAHGPVTFDARLAAGERVVVEGTTVTLGAGIFLAPGSELIVRAAEGVVFTPGIDLSGGGRLISLVSGSALAKPAGLQAPVEAFSTSVRRTSGGLALRYALPEAGRVAVRILDAQGRTVFRTSLRARAAGRHEEILRFEPKRSGLYLVRADLGRKSVTQRLMLTAR